MRMRDRYTGTVFEVAPENVAARLASGLVPLDGCAPAPAAPEPDPEPEPEPVGDAPAGPEPDPAQPAPDETWTIAEIKAWAAERGVGLPAKAAKADMLAALEGV